LAYARHYGANSLRWVLDQEIIGGRIVASFPALDKLPPKSRVLVVGLDTPFLPWRSENYIASRFGRGRHWTVMVKPGDSTPSPGPLSRLTAPEFLNLSDFDAVAIYDADGRLQQIKHVGSAEAAAGLAPFVPGLRDALQTAEHQPQSYENWMTVASKCLDWGLWDEAQRYLRRADPTRAANDALWHIEFGRASAAMEQISDAERELAAAKNLIARIKPDAAVAQQASQLEHAIFTLRAQPVSTLVAVPPRIDNPNAHGLGMVQLKWFTRPGRQVEIHVNAPDGQMLTSGQSTGQAWTGEWVSNGMEFFLQDVTDGRPLTPRFTLARVKIAVTSR
jgi:hypothetical protein